MGSVEISVSLNLIKFILKFGNFWITCFRFLNFGGVPLGEVEFPSEQGISGKGN